MDEDIYYERMYEELQEPKVDYDDYEEMKERANKRLQMLQEVIELLKENNPAEAYEYLVGEGVENEQLD